MCILDWIKYTCTSITFLKKDLLLFPVIWTIFFVTDLLKNILSRKSQHFCCSINSTSTVGNATFSFIFFFFISPVVVNKYLQSDITIKYNYIVMSLGCVLSHQENLVCFGSIALYLFSHKSKQCHASKLFFFNSQLQIIS